MGIVGICGEVHHAVLSRRSGDVVILDQHDVASAAGGIARIEQQLVSDAAVLMRKVEAELPLIGRRPDEFALKTPEVRIVDVLVDRGVTQNR